MINFATTILFFTSLSIQDSPTSFTFHYFLISIKHNLFPFYNLLLIFSFVFFRKEERNPSKYHKQAESHLKSKAS